jgi:hypothetical protein
MTAVMSVAATRKREVPADAASGMIAHNRYQGCRATCRTITAPSETPRPIIGR